MMYSIKKIKTCKPLLLVSIFSLLIFIQISCTGSKKFQNVDIEDLGLKLKIPDSNPKKSISLKLSSPSNYEEGIIVNKGIKVDVWAYSNLSKDINCEVTGSTESQELVKVKQSKPNIAGTQSMFNISSEELFASGCEGMQEVHKSKHPIGSRDLEGQYTIYLEGLVKRWEINPPLVDEKWFQDIYIKIQIWVDDDPVPIEKTYHALLGGDSDDYFRDGTRTINEHWTFNYIR